MHDKSSDESRKTNCAFRFVRPSQSRIIRDEAVLFSNHSEELFCKRGEEERIVSAIAPIAKRERCENVFVHGPSGSGKTQLIKHVLGHIKRQNPRVLCLYVNCWYHSTSMAVYTRIADTLGEFVSRRGRASDEVFDRILGCMKRDNIPVLLALDEIDGLISKDDTRILHNIARVGDNGVRFGIIGVSEDLNILSRLCPRIRGSLRFNIIELKGYTKEQLFDILKERAELGLAKGSYDEAILWRMAEIGSENNGNARLALEILRKSAKRAEVRGENTITAGAVHEVAYKLCFRRTTMSREEQIIVDILKRGEKSSSQLYWLFCKRLIRTKRQIRNYLRGMEGKGLIEIRPVWAGKRPKFMLLKLKNNGW